MVRGNTAGSTEMAYDEVNEYFAYDPGEQVCQETDQYVDRRGPTTVYTCPTAATITSTIAKSLPSVTQPYSLTGVGILVRVLVSPSTSVYSGAQIQEVVTPVSNTCPESIASSTSIEGGTSTFTVGASAFWEGVTYGSVVNSFYDQHIRYSYLDLLGTTSASSCTATGTQVYSCNGSAIKALTITKTYSHGMVSGQSVTNVTASLN